jgi:hypothetical protein
MIAFYWFELSRIAWHPPATFQPPAISPGPYSARFLMQLLSCQYFARKASGCLPLPRQAAF